MYLPGDGEWPIRDGDGMSMKVYARFLFHRDKVASYADADGAKVVVDGRTVMDGAGQRNAGGFWLGPTLLDNHRRDRPSR